MQKSAIAVTQAETPDPHVAIISSLIEISLLEKIEFNSSKDLS